ncbi:hypothetical protein P7K49_034528 [Saguinus oedipus]|uniref:Uncharacterized protein n=1 Tax=Saguinus oedipus TaxID=9490 RepID=A0ABQ9TUY6_SAGOE|nr:hypothetical protein P7K49_034528 [Saguinus oedipus]
MRTLSIGYSTAGAVDTVIPGGLHFPEVTALGSPSSSRSFSGVRAAKALREYEQENEEKIKQEQQDLELKHNSTLKQLMREFNTQLAQKEQELEVTIKETVNKAQDVEDELLESHQEETNQLLKKSCQERL